jgi:cell division septum initiation protein DivIVA
MSRGGKPTDISKKQGSQKALRADTAERLEAIVEAAERAAESVIDDAEAQARRYLAQARAEADRMAVGRGGELGDLIETLLGQAISLRREAERLQATLEETRERIEPGGAPSTEGRQRSELAEEQEPEETPRLRAVPVEDAPAPASAQPSERSSDAPGARLLATQMAVSGSSREEIAERLRNGFEIEDAGAILDAILGPEER